MLASSPHSVEALVARAKAHRAAEQLPEALQDLALAHDLNPTNRFLNLQFEKELTLRAMTTDLVCFHKCTFHPLSYWPF